MNGSGVLTAAHPARLAERYSADSVAGRPILELGARLWEPARYAAFAACYGAMRAADDLVDDARSGGAPVLPDRKAGLIAELRRRMIGGYPDGPGSDIDGTRYAADSPGAAGESAAAVAREFAVLARVRSTFAIPDTPWIRWCRAMEADLDRNGFTTFGEYLRYAEGAAVAPGTIFMHLCGIRPVGSRYRPPDFDARAAARSLAIFCYLVHIVRDFRIDQLQGLHYFADDVLARAGVVRDDLRPMAEAGVATPPLRRLVAEYRRLAARYLDRAERDVGRVATRMEPEYAASLRIVLRLYRLIHEKNRDASAVARGATSLTIDETLTGIRAAL